MRSYKAAGIILSRTNYGEAGRIYNVLTPEGRVSALAKGVRRPGSKLGPHLELFARIELILVQGRGLDIITGARLVKAYSGITADLAKTKRGFLFCEMVNKLTSPQASTELFELLERSLEALSKELPLNVVELDFKLKLLDLLGYRPNLEQSLTSHKPVGGNESYAFSHEGGGLVEKSGAGVMAPRLGPNEIKLWRLLLRHPLDEALKVQGLEPVAAKSLPIIDDFFTYTFDKRFKSLEI